MARPRARDLGITIGGHQTGPYNAITDVSKVRVGHTTIHRPPDIHTGVTSVIPHGIGPKAPLPAGVFAGNGYGKLIGATQVEELGQIETPLVLTATLSAFRVADALVSWMLERPECAGVQSLNPLVGECNDGFLSDVRARPIRDVDVAAALDAAVGGSVVEGCVGAGTGTGALGYKAGIGTSSRQFDLVGSAVTVGALVQANFGGTLRVRGQTIRSGDPGVVASTTADDGSCMIVIATDAPLDARQLKRIARRAVFALGRVGASYSHGSGDYAVAFSTPPLPGAIPDASLSPLFEATMDAVEESVLNSLLAATTTVGRDGHILQAISPDAFRGD